MEPRTVTAGQGWTWIKQGFALFRKSPAVWLAMLLALYLTTKLLSLSPLLGIVFILFMPLFIAGLAEGCRELERGGTLAPGHLLCGFRHNATHLVTIGGISLVGNLGIMMIVVGLSGDAMSVMSKAMTGGPPGTPQALEEMRTAAQSVGRALLVGMLVSLPLVMALWFAPLLVYFHDQSPLAAMKASLMACFRNAGAMLVFGLAIFAGMFLAMPFSMSLRQYDLALWLLAPVVLPALYVSYKDIFLAGAAPPGRTDSAAG